jgi:hypothetical protein
MMGALTKSTISRYLQSLKFDPLKLTKWVQNPKLRELRIDNTFYPDYLVEIIWERNRYKFVVEIQPQSTPKKIDEAIFQLRSYLENLSQMTSDQNYFPLLITSYLNQERLDRLIRYGVSGIDLSGNGIIIVPNELFVYKTGEKNKFRSSATIKNIYRGVSSTISRVFFSKSEYKSVGDVVGEINRRGFGISFSTVSKVLKILEEELIISRNKGVKLIDGPRLLNNLKGNYRFPVIDKRLRGKVYSLQTFLDQIRKNAARKKVPYAINDPTRYTVLPSEGSSIKIYTKSIEDLLGKIEIEETNRFPNIELIESEEETFYFDRIENEGFFWVSPLEVYLELANRGKREQEMAQTMAAAILSLKQ